MDAIATQLAQLQEQVHALSLLPSVVARLSKENEDQASSISLLQSTNESLSSEVESLKSLVRFHETEAHPRGRFLYDPVGVVVGGVVKGCWRWHSAFYSLTDAALAVGIAPFATLEHLPLEIMDEITGRLRLSDKATLLGVSHRVSNLAFDSVYKEVVLDGTQVLIFFLGRSYFTTGPRFIPEHLFLRPTDFLVQTADPHNGSSSRSPMQILGEHYGSLNQPQPLPISHLHLVSQDFDHPSDLNWTSVLRFLNPTHLHFTSSLDLAVAQPTISAVRVTRVAGEPPVHSFKWSFGWSSSGGVVWSALRDVTMTGRRTFVVRQGASSEVEFAFGQALQDAQAARDHVARTAVAVKASYARRPYEKKPFVDVPRVPHVARPLEIQLYTTLEGGGPLSSFIREDHLLSDFEDSVAPPSTGTVVSRVVVVRLAE